MLSVKVVREPAGVVGTPPAARRSEAEPHWKPAPKRGADPEGRRRMVVCVLDGGWTIEATAERFPVEAKTVRKWRDRFLAEGAPSLQDRSSRPKRTPNRTSPSCRGRVVHFADGAAGVLTWSRRARWLPTLRLPATCPAACGSQPPRDASIAKGAVRGSRGQARCGCSSPRSSSPTTAAGRALCRRKPSRRAARPDRR
jgi:transposase-like protein